MLSTALCLSQEVNFALKGVVHFKMKISPRFTHPHQVYTSDGFRASKSWAYFNFQNFQGLICNFQQGLISLYKFK